MIPATCIDIDIDMVHNTVERLRFTGIDTSVDVPTSDLTRFDHTKQRQRHAPFCLGVMVTRVHRYPIRGSESRNCKLQNLHKPIKTQYRASC